MKQVFALIILISSISVFSMENCDECMKKYNPQGTQLTDEVELINKALSIENISEEELENFCNSIEEGFDTNIQEFYRLITGLENEKPSQNEIVIYWNYFRENLICPEDEISDPEHFLKKATDAYNLDFIHVLVKNFNLDMNFAIHDPSTGSKFTVLDFLTKNRDDGLKTIKILSKDKERNKTSIKVKSETIDNLNSLINELIKRGAKSSKDLI